MHNHNGSMVAMIMMLMSFLLISVTLLWQGVLTMHDSAIARQQYMFKKVAIEDLLYYAIACVRKGTSKKEYLFDRWPLHSRAQWWWQAKVVITIADSRYHINANIYDKEHVVLCGSCKLTTTVEASDSIWFVDAWTIE